jgi:diguanylate cyclase (GGDEF)-like protein
MEIKTMRSSYEETDGDRRRAILGANALTVDLVSALAGDRPLTAQEKHHLDRRREDRGRRFFSDLFYAITHQYFPPEAAENLWDEVLQHKKGLSNALARNVRTVVATLDYLSNITGDMHSPTLVCETVIEEIVGQSFRDGLTGLFNHSYFSEQIDLEVLRFLRYGVPVSLMMIDIDDFKGINDSCGHQEGDRILNIMSTGLMREARESDTCCRYGGEEFAVILPLTDMSIASRIAERVQLAMTTETADSRKVTVSMGVASCCEITRSYRDLVRKADAALYQAKRNGKNRLESSTVGWRYSLTQGPPPI